MVQNPEDGVDKRPWVEGRVGTFVDEEGAQIIDDASRSFDMRDCVAKSCDESFDKGEGNSEWESVFCLFISETAAAVNRVPLR